MKSTFMPKPADAQRQWWVLDAEGQTLGRLATKAAALLRGKHKATFTPFMDMGDNVIIINADKVVLSGKKLEQKQYVRYTGYPGGLRKKSYAEFLRDQPEKAVEKAVFGMLPHNRLGRKARKKLFVYRGPEHPHMAQQPKPYEG